MIHESSSGTISWPTRRVDRDRGADGGRSAHCRAEAGRRNPSAARSSNAALDAGAAAVTLTGLEER